MKKLYELKDRLYDQLEEYADKDINNTILDIIDKLAHSIKNIDKVIDKCEEREYSNGHAPYYRMPYTPSYDGGYGMNSYARGMGARRDASGRYTGGYSRNGDIIVELTELMEDAPDERTRMELQKFIQKMQTI